MAEQDPRFARLRTDPRFRKQKKSQTKIVVDDRFKGIFDQGKGKGKTKGKIDKYGRPVSETKDRDNLRRFYKLEGDDEETGTAAPDYARGEGLVESSDEGEDDDKDDKVADDLSDGEGSSDGGAVTLGRNVHKQRRQKTTLDETELEIDLDESQFPGLDAQASADAKKADDTVTGEETSRLAVVNLDWDHVQASHLFKIFDSLVSPGGTSSRRGKIHSVRVYPSEFGKERMEREEREGPPAEVFRRKPLDDEDLEEDDINEKTILQEDDGEEYDEDALRKYQLERLRYYYAIVTCDSVSTAAHIYKELDGTELERSANIFDLSFVPEDMDFGEEFRDEATGDSGVGKGVEFVTDALRHSKVKLTWDGDDANRAQVTRRNLTLKEIEENDFRAYIASSSDGSASSDSEVDGDAPVLKKESKEARRERMRKLLLSNDNNDDLPEGWGGMTEEKGNMEVTFMPGLSEAANALKADDDNETTLERYQRRQKEKKLARKTAQEARKAKDGGDAPSGSVSAEAKRPIKQDDFFGDDSAEEGDKPTPKADKKKQKGKKDLEAAIPSKQPSTAEELSLILAPDHAGPSNEPKHFDMKAVLKAEKEAKRKGKKPKGKKKNADNTREDGEDGQDFTVNVADDRFNALYEQPEFAIDPSNPQFKSTKSMTALLQERTRRHKEKERTAGESRKPIESRAEVSVSGGSSDIKSLVESVKRKSKGLGDNGGGGKRRKV